MKIVVVIPTYNEKENISLLVPEIIKAVSGAVHEFSILVVDDESPDGTADVVRNLQETYTNTHLITGKRRGLGNAYIRGITHALNNLNADAIFQMDADFSHNPGDILRLASFLDGYDVVIGSRYVSGGSVPHEWGLLRKIISFTGNLCARHIAGISPVRDCTSGFRAIRASYLRSVDMNSLRTEGYAFLVALLHSLISLGARVKETPIKFVDRSRGETKLGFGDIVGFILNCWWIRYNTSKTFLKFAIVGLSGVVVNLGIFSILLNLGMTRFIASPIAIEISIITNFLLNNFWTFRTADPKRFILRKGLKFKVVSLGTLCLSYGVFVVTSLAFPLIPPQLCQLVGILLAMVFNYFLNSRWTFKGYNN
jgi:dolichol-phosphate mannosyltransferase